MQSSQLKCIHPQHFVKKYEKRQELCNATPVNTYSILYRCLRLPKQKRKHALLFEQQFSPEFYYYVALQMFCELLSYYDQCSIILTFCVCDVATQRDPDLCDLHRACFGIDVAHFLFVQIRRSSPLKIKNNWGSKIRLMYSLLTYRLQQCSTPGAYCELGPFHLVVRQNIVHCNQRFFVELPMTRYSMIVHVKYFYSCLMDMLA